MGQKPYSILLGITTILYLVTPSLAQTGTTAIYLPSIHSGSTVSQPLDPTRTTTPVVKTTTATITLPPTSTAKPSKTAPPTSTKQPTATKIPAVTIEAAGDIAAGGSPSYETADLVKGLPGLVLTLGDNAYPNGSIEDFQRNFEPTWGQFKERIYPSPGNHDYDSAGQTGYFDYYGARAGEAGKGWYSFDDGAWHIISLNSNCWIDDSDPAPVSCAPGSEQYEWLQADLAAHPAQCTLAYWHHPLFNSGSDNPPADWMQPFWQVLYDAGVDVVLNGHAHSYERFALQDPDGILDPQNGILEIVAGTGGNTLEGFRPDPAANSLVRNNENYGVLQMVLSADGYSYQFLGLPDGTGFTDSGSGVCH